jgi:hypothetical protein
MLIPTLPRPTFVAAGAEHDDEGTLSYLEPVEASVAPEWREIQFDGAASGISLRLIDGTAATVVAVALAKQNSHLIHTATVVDAKTLQRVQQIETRLDYLQTLADGWRGPGSRAPLNDVMNRVRKVIPAIALASPEVGIVPIPDGGVSLEWRDGSREMTAEIQADGALFLCSDDADNDELTETTLPFAASALRSVLSTGTWID